MVQAGRLPNPGFSVGRLTRGGEVELARGLHFNLARLIALPALAAVQARRFEQTQAAVAMTLLSLAADTRKAYFKAVAAQQGVRYLRQVKQAAEASAELAQRMAQVGNFNALQRAREQLFSADAALNLARAEQAQRAARERLTRLLGLWGAQTQFTLPERLPDLPKAVLDLPDIERLALAQRLDVQGARLAAEQTARKLGLTRATRFVNVLELGLRNNRSNELPTQRGWEIGFELPLFDGGGALRNNGMLIGVFELLADQAHHKPAAASAAAASDLTDGEVRKIDLDTARITLKHGEIKNLDMPAMTMVFAVKDKALCGKLPAGLKVRWDFEADQPLDVNVHYHLGKRVVLPSRHSAVTQAGATLEAQTEQDYCWMWTNQRAAPARLSVRLQR